jgi:Zn-dependent protease
MILRFVPMANEMMATFIMIIIQINLILMVFNLVPIPPMDGSKVIMPFLPHNLQVKYAELEKYGMFLVLLFVMFGFTLIIPIINFLFRLIVGV